MNLKQAWSMLRWSVRQRGIVGTVRTALRRGMGSRSAAGVEEISRFDREFGTDTDGYIGGGRLATGSPNDLHNASYHGIPPSRFHAGVARWREVNGGQDLKLCSFVDLGCGKGRAILMASEYDFGEVVGVELSAQLYEIGLGNVARWRELGRVKCPVRLVCGDVTEFEFPVRRDSTGRCAVYMYNPFAAPVMQEVIGNIERQFGDRGGELDVLYFNPVLRRLFDEHPGFRLLWSGVLPLSEADGVSSANEICNIYRWVGFGGIA